jgi:hypothetical protein
MFSRALHARANLLFYITARILGQSGKDRSWESPSGLG